MEQHRKSFLRDEKGATAIEYGLLASMIAAVIIGGVTILGTSIEDLYNALATIMKSAWTP